MAAKPHFFDIHTDAPPAPDISLIQLLHRNDQTHVAFLRREQPSDESLRPFTHVRADRLPSKRAKLEAALVNDGYFSINGFWRGGTRQTGHLAALNAAAVDLDFYRSSPPPLWQTVVETVECAVRESILPLPSIVVRSGRGAWLLWLLIADDDPAAAPQARRGNQLWLRSVNQHLASLIQHHYPHLGADASSAELTRCLRIPGSLNSRSASLVHFLVHDTPWGSPLAYTLERLSRELGVSPPSYLRHQPALLEIRLPSEERTRSASPRGGTGNRARLLTHRLKELESLEHARCGFAEGHRNRASLIITSTLRGLGRSDVETEDYMHAIAARCRPPLSSAEVRAAIAMSGRRHYKFLNTRIAGDLNVSVEEADAIGLTHIRPDYRPKHPEANIPKGRKDSTAQRRAELRTIAEEAAGALPTLRELAQRLRGRGFVATLRTIGRDLDALGIARNQKRGRPKPGGRQLKLPQS